MGVRSKVHCVPAFWLPPVALARFPVTEVALAS